MTANSASQSPLTEPASLASGVRAARVQASTSSLDGDGVDENEREREEIIRLLYGPWRARRPADAAELLDGYAGLW